MHPRACQLNFAGKRGLPRTDESIRHTAPSLIYWWAAAPQHLCGRPPPDPNALTFLFLPACRPYLAVSLLFKGPAHEVDAQKLTASLNTDKSRFLTLCYAPATLLDDLIVLMQATIQRRSLPTKTGNECGSPSSSDVCVVFFCCADFTLRLRFAKRPKRPGFPCSSARPPKAP